MHFKILITSVGGELSPSVILSIKKERNITTEVIGTDIKSKAIGKNFCDYFYKVPEPNQKKYVTKISSICKKHKIDLVLPTSDEEALILSKNRRIIEKNYTKLACTNFKSIKIFNDKISTYKKLEKFSFPKTNYKIIKSQDMLLKEINKMLTKYNEIVCKPSNSRGGRNVYIISKKNSGYKIFQDRREILTDISSFKKKFKQNLISNYPLILMEKLKEPVYDLDILAWKGKSIAVIPRKRVN